MKIILVGHGKTGSKVAEIARHQGHSILEVITSKNEEKIKELPPPDADTILIHFALPHTVLPHMEVILPRKYAVLIGTTGWYQHIPKVKELALKHKTTVVYSSNFSPLILLMHIMAARLGTFLNDHKQKYNVIIEEKHHAQKKDRPSGTAITLASEIINHCDWLTGWTLSPDGNPTTISITSIREGDIRGEHTIRVISPLEEMSIHHTVRDRAVFATGAITAGAIMLELLKSGKLPHGCFPFLKILNDITWTRSK